MSSLACYEKAWEGATPLPPPSAALPRSPVPLGDRSDHLAHLLAVWSLEGSRKHL